MADATAMPIATAEPLMVVADAMAMPIATAEPLMAVANATTMPADVIVQQNMVSVQHIVVVNQQAPTVIAPKPLFELMNVCKTPWQHSSTATGEYDMWQDSQPIAVTFKGPPTDAEGATLKMWVEERIPHSWNASFQLPFLIPRLLIQAEKSATVQTLLDRGAVFLQQDGTGQEC